jgi:hypothetical protein
MGSGEAVSIRGGPKAIAELGGAARIAAAEDAVSAPDGVGGHESSLAAGSRPGSNAGVTDGVVATSPAWLPVADQMTSARSTVTPTPSAIHNGRVERRANAGTSKSVESTGPDRFARPAKAAWYGSQDGRNAVASCSRSSCAASLGIPPSPAPQLKGCCPLTMAHDRTIGRWGGPFPGDESGPQDADRGLCGN